MLEGLSLSLVTILCTCRLSHIFVPRWLCLWYSPIFIGTCAQRSPIKRALSLSFSIFTFIYTNHSNRGALTYSRRNLDTVWLTVLCSWWSTIMSRLRGILNCRRCHLRKTFLYLIVVTIILFLLLSWCNYLGDKEEELREPSRSVRFKFIFGKEIKVTEICLISGGKWI